MAPHQNTVTHVDPHAPLAGLPPGEGRDQRTNEHIPTFDPQSLYLRIPHLQTNTPFVRLFNFYSPLCIHFRPNKFYLTIFGVGHTNISLRT